MISIHDKNFKITRVNKAFANAFKKEPKELVGKICYELYHGAKQPCQDCPHIQSLKTKEPSTLELFEPCLGIHLGISTSPVLDENGKVTSSVHIAKDITERKLAEEKLKKANEKLKEYNQLKDEFVSTASHELRTPLSIIMGAIRLTLDEIPGKIVEEQRDVLATAMENVQRLGRIVDSLLSISKIESGKLDLQKTVINICELIKDTVSNYEPLAQEKGIRLGCEFPQESVDICLDPDKTKEVLINLISNSLKFTPEGGWVKVICTKQDGEVLVSVQDSGVGIAKEDIPKLFDKFTQFGRKAGPGEKGTGLGLAIAKKLIEMHGGKIEVESEVNQGTTFTISLPLTTKAAAEVLSAETDELVETTLANN
jgi:PAS domain S-box-containing protein